jgi:hypothetical protein
MKTVIDFLKILPDTATFPNFVGEKIFITKAYIKKIKSIDGSVIFEFLGHNLSRPQKFEKPQKTKK